MKQNVKVTAFYLLSKSHLIPSLSGSLSRPQGFLIIFSYSKLISEGLTSLPVILFIPGLLPFLRLVAQDAGWDRDAGPGPPHLLPLQPGVGVHSLILGLCHGRDPSLWCDHFSDELQLALEAVNIAGLQTLAVSWDTVWVGSVGDLSGLPHSTDSPPRRPGSTPPQLLPPGG